MHRQQALTRLFNIVNIENRSNGRVADILNTFEHVQNRHL
jgi:hypothetical protein